MDTYSEVPTGYLVFPAGTEIWRGGKKGIQQDCRKCILLRLIWRIFCAAADFTLVFCISHAAFYWHLMEEEYCFNNAECLLTVLAQLFPRVDCVV